MYRHVAVQVGDPSLESRLVGTATADGSGLMCAWHCVNLFESDANVFQTIVRERSTGSPAALRVVDVVRTNYLVTAFPDPVISRYVVKAALSDFGQGLQ